MRPSTRAASELPADTESRASLTSSRSMLNVLPILLAAARIVSLSPNATEILHGIGAFDRVVAVSTFCEYPPEVAKPPPGGRMDQHQPRAGPGPRSGPRDPLGRSSASGRKAASRARPRDPCRSGASPSRISTTPSIRSAGPWGIASKRRRFRNRCARSSPRIEALVRGRPRPRTLVVVDRLPGTLRDVYIATRGQLSDDSRRNRGRKADRSRGAAQLHADRRRGDGSLRPRGGVRPGPGADRSRGGSGNERSSRRTRPRSGGPSRFKR